MYKQNQSRRHFKRLCVATRRLLLSETRRREKLHLEKHDKLRRAEHERQQRALKQRKRAAAAQRKSDQETKLDSIGRSLFSSCAALPAARAVTVARLREELAWHRHRGSKAAWPADAKAVSNAPKAKLHAWLVRILEYWDAHPEARPHLAVELEPSAVSAHDATKTLIEPGNDPDDLDEEEELELVGL
ncbi:hypothetical protein AURDEDRAFT_124392 [Auricularia subglabra TFB-10046 SS5]|nr:hypothetical protein AURDEDRAFT_124392 [Auricularia subglabra TFB-10046 SS5]